MRSLENKRDELRARITTHREVRECCALIFTETWLSDKVSDCAFQLQTHSVHRADRTAASGKVKGGGVCVFINNSWCGDVRTVHKHCSPDVEFLLLRCRPYYLPREFTAVFLAAIYIPPRANSTAALSELYDVISAHETDAAFIAAGDFNHCNLKTIPQIFPIPIFQFPPVIRTHWIMFTAAYVVPTGPHPAPTSGTQTTSLCSCILHTDKG